MPIRSTTCFITSTGHGEPAIIPVRSELRSNVAGALSSSTASSAMNIAGTPSSDVQRSCATAASVARGSKEGAG